MGKVFGGRCKTATSPFELWVKDEFAFHKHRAFRPRELGIRSIAVDDPWDDTAFLRNSMDEIEWLQEPAGNFAVESLVRYAFDDHTDHQIVGVGIRMIFA